MMENVVACCLLLSTSNRELIEFEERMISDALINDFMQGLATGLPVALILGAVVVYRMFRTDRDYKALLDKVGKDGYSELMSKSWAADVKGVNKLIDKGVDVNAQDKNGMTALMHACTRADRIDVLKMLIDAGADPAMRRVTGERAL